MTGSFGDAYGGEGGGAVYLSLNGGRKGAPAFGPLRVLVPRSNKGGTAPTRPDAGLYPEAVDWDGDGDLDLIVGGYSMWTPEGRKLSDVEQAEAARLQARRKELNDRRTAWSGRYSAALKAATAGLERGSNAYVEKRAAVLMKYSTENRKLAKESRALRERLDALVPSPQRKTFVWFYERR